MNTKVAIFIVWVLSSITMCAQKRVSPTRYDYSQVSQQITAGCTSKYEQAFAIYRWLCDNIAYDTSYSIYYADDCYEQRKGVCNAYSELFYRLAEPLGLRTIIINGTSRNALYPNGGGHAWLYVIVEEPDKGILIDATWGAGSVNGKEFKRNDNDNSWFDVDPRWMIFTHFPDNQDFQFLPQTISRTQFFSLPYWVKPWWGEYGLNVGRIFEQCLAGNTDLPTVWTSKLRNKISIVEAPMQSTLNVGESYRFTVKPHEDVGLAIIDSSWHRDWTIDSISGTATIVVTPSAAGGLKLSVKPKDDTQYWSVLGYNVK